MSTIPRWNEDVATLDTFQSQVRIFKLSMPKDKRFLCAAKLMTVMPGTSKQFRNCSQLSEVVLSEETGKGCDAILAMLREKGGPPTIQVALKNLKELMSGRLHRTKGETMRSWCNKFKLHVTKTGKALHSVDPTIDQHKFLHPLILGVLLMQGTGLDPSEEAAVLATSGSTETATATNSYRVTDLMMSLQSQWSDDAIAKRDAKHFTSPSTAFGHSSQLGSGEPPPPESGPMALEERVEQLTELVAHLRTENLPEPELGDPQEGYGQPAEPQDDSGAYADPDVAEAFAVATRTFAEAEALRKAFNTSRGHFPVGKGAAPGARPSGYKGSGGSGGKGGGRFDGHCLLCSKYGHKAVDCRSRGYAGSRQQRASELGAFTGGMMGRTVPRSPVRASPLFPTFVGFCIDEYQGLAILDGGASKSAAGFPCLQHWADSAAKLGTPARISEASVDFTFAGGAGTKAQTMVSLGLPDTADMTLDVFCVPTTGTPILIGTDMLRKWGLVLDYMHGTVYSHILSRFLDAVWTVGGHLALACVPQME